MKAQMGIGSYFNCFFNLVVRYGVVGEFNDFSRPLHPRKRDPVGLMAGLDGR